MLLIRSYDYDAPSLTSRRCHRLVTLFTTTVAELIVVVTASNCVNYDCCIVYRRSHDL